MDRVQEEMCNTTLLRWIKLCDVVGVEGNYLDVDYDERELMWSGMQKMSAATGTSGSRASSSFSAWRFES